MEHVGAGIDQRLEKRGELIRRMRQLCAVVLLLPLREAVNDDEIRPHTLADRLDDVGGEAGTSDEVSTVSAVAAVRLLPEELVHQIAVRTMQFDRVEANLLAAAAFAKASTVSAISSSVIGSPTSLPEPDNPDGPSDLPSGRGPVPALRTMP